MNEQDYQLVSQYLDGEMDDLTARRFEQRLSSEPDLKATLSQMGAQDQRIKQAFIGTEHAPEQILDILRPSPSNVVALPQRSDRPAWQYAVAASLVAAAGLLLTPNWQASTPSGSSLASVLESSPSMANGWETLSDGREVRPVLSFREVDGAWCREYLMVDADAAKRGVACRDDGQWNTRVLAATDIPGDASDFRPAGAGDADEVASYLAEHAAGIALSASDEQALIAADWEH